MGDRCETCGEDYTCRRCKCMRTDVTPPDDAPQTGQTSEYNAAGQWLPQPRSNGTTIRVLRRIDDSGDEEFYSPDGGLEGGDVQDGIWHSLDPKALAEMRDAIASKLFADRNGRQPGFLADQVMQALNLTPPEPKEGAA